MTLDLATRATGGYPADLRAAAGLKISKVGLRADISLDLSQTQRLDSAPAGGLVPVQDPATGLIQALDFSQLPTSNPADGSVANAKLTAVPSLTVKGNTTAASAQPQDVPLSALAVAGNPIGDAIVSRLLKGGADITALPDNSVGNIPFGNTAAKQTMHSRRAGPQSSLLGTTALTRTTVGSGIFGPGGADYALLLGAVKELWDTATGAAAIQGEIDAAYIVARQGKKGDLAGVCVDLAKRRDALSVIGADEDGGILGFELLAYLVNAAGQNYYENHSFASFIESPLGMLKGAVWGFMTKQTKGAGGCAFGATIDPGGTPWSRLTLLDTTGAFDGSGIIFEIDGQGRVISGLPVNRTISGYNSGNDLWSVTDESGGIMLAVGRTSKTLTVPKLQIGGGNIQTFLRAGTGSAAIPTLPAHDAATMATLAVPGAAINDLVTVTITSGAAGYNGFRVFGVVTAANTVEIRVQNATNTTAGGFAGSYAYKVERFA